MRKYRSHDEYLVESLKSPRAAALYLNAAAEEGDPAVILVALSQVARAHKIARMAKRISLTRMGLYKSLSKKGNPEFRTFFSILTASGIQLAFKPISRAA
jgi:probable addiction module antidote protein